MKGGFARGIALAAAAALALLAAGCGSSAPKQSTSSSAPKQITIGTLYANSGSYATSSMPEYAGLKFWASQVNKQGGVFVKAYNKKIPVKIIAYNDQSDPATASTLYTQLITQDKVNLLVSDFGSVLTSAGYTIAAEHHMVFWDVTGTGASFFQNNPYIVLTSLPTSGVWPKSLAGFLQSANIGSISVVYLTNDFDQSQDQTLVSALQGTSVKVLSNVGVPDTTSNYTVYIHNAQQKHPDALIEFGYPNNDIAFLQNLQSSGYQPKMVFTIFPGQLLSLLQQNVGTKGLQYTFTYPTPPLIAYNSQVNYGMTMDQFSQAFQAASGSAPNFLDIAGYNAGLVMQKALETSKSLKQEDLKAAAESFSGNIFTLDGQFKIDSSGAQVGESLPVGQLVPSGGTLKMVVVYPQNVATGSAVFGSH